MFVYLTCATWAFLSLGHVCSVGCDLCFISEVKVSMTRHANGCRLENVFFSVP